MKTIFLSTVLLSSFTSFAQSNCLDSNFNSVDVDFFPEDMAESPFVELFSTQSPAPIGFPEMFGDYETPCRDLSVTYVQHKESKKQYAMYRTQDDYCDGGNTIGLVIDLEKYKDLKLSFADSIVGEIGDGEFYCLEK
ncbi:MAG: hypothetical protein CME65_10215 [Halobacteriovoraceae bacterium]|nr:hypothetical protein [Halobacteriovoraceae bacterium]|tara:strand:- start:1927 stop:2337 length:411 start_codon:yes stop_codon:yes gene_type:complete